MRSISDIAFLIKRLTKKLLFWPTSPFITFLLGQPWYYFTGRSTNSGGIDLSQIDRVLVIRLDDIGDMVMLTPFLRELRHNLPDAWISLVVKPEIFSLFETCPYVNEVLCFDSKAARLIKPYKRHWRAFKLSYQRLWPRRFDLALLPRWDSDVYHGTTLAYFSGASRRVGFSEKVNVEKQNLNQGYDRLLTHVVHQTGLEHEVRRNLDMLRFLGMAVPEDRLELWLTEEDKRLAAEMLSAHDYDPKIKLIAFAPGAALKGRQWPLSHFIELGSWLKEKYGAQIIVTGGPGEEALGTTLQAALHETIINLVGKTTLRQTAAVLRHCQLFIGNDSGPKHLAAAMHIPVIEVSRFPRGADPMHRESPRRFGPYGVAHRILQPIKTIPPCTEICTADEAHCIRGVTVTQVKTAVIDILPNQHRSCPADDT